MIMFRSTSESTTMDIRKQFLTYLHQPSLCELFYSFMKDEHLAYVLEFYLACDGLKNLFQERKKPDVIIALIYKHYLSPKKALASSKPCTLPHDLLDSIEQRLAKREFHWTFYDQAQDYVLKYMLQMCFPKFLIEQKNRPAIKRQATGTSTFTPMYRRTKSTKKKDPLEKVKPSTVAK